VEVTIRPRAATGLRDTSRTPSLRTRMRRTGWHHDPITASIAASTWTAAA
jgi:hypothetical protein